MTGTEEFDPNDERMRAALTALLEAAEFADGGPAISDQALRSLAEGRRIAVARFAERPDTVPGDTDGGAGMMQGSGSGPTLEAVGLLGEGELDLVVHPEARGRGIGGSLLAELLELTGGAADRMGGAAGSPDGAADAQRLTAWAHGTQPAAEALLARSGFRPIRALHRMTLDPARLDAAARSLKPLPQGVVVRAFDGSEADREAWLMVNARAFASHPEQGRVDRADLDATIREPWFDARDLLLAFDGGNLVGFTWIKSTPLPGGGVETELYVLGVDPSRSGEGLGSALLRATLERMREHDPRRISLYVDGGNDRAHALYERSGFAVERASTQWELERGRD